MKCFGDADGATAIEYAMIASIVSIVIFAGVQSIGQTVLHFFSSIVAPAV
jgi:Flp pilus assembly pilin Flp